MGVYHLEFWKLDSETQVSEGLVPPSLSPWRVGSRLLPMSSCGLDCGWRIPRVSPSSYKDTSSAG